MTGHDIELFSRPGCPYCRLAREYFATRGLAVCERDVTADAEALRRMLLLSGHASVPVIRAGREVLIGFDREKLDRMVADWRDLCETAQE